MTARRVTTDYEIVESPSAADISRIVQERIDQGWQPQGPLLVRSSGTLAQLIVRHEYIDAAKEEE